MSVAGTWALVIATPIGKQRVVLELAQRGDALTGVAKGEAEEVELADLRLDGNRLTWAQAITKPLRLNLTFDVTIDGDSLAGKSKAGRLPASKVTGRRVTFGR
jgi:hypothetical protein